MTCQSPTHHTGCDCHEAKRDTEIAQCKDSERALAELLKQKMSEAVLQEKLILALQTALAAVTKGRDELAKMNSDGCDLLAASRAECAALKADYQRWTEYAKKWKSVSEIIAQNAVLRSALDGIAKESQGFIKCHEWEIRCNAGNSNIAVMETRIKWANEALSTSSGEALAAVRGAMRTLDDVDGAFSNNNAMDFEDIPRALAELKRIFGDAAEGA